MGINLVVFCGTQEIKDINIKENVVNQFELFLERNKEKINSIFYGGGRSGVMGLVFDIAKKVGISIKGFNLEKYRDFDVNNGVDMDYFPNDLTRVSKFAEVGDIFLALPGGEGTIREVGFVVDMLLDGNKNKKVYISSTFEVYVEMLKKLDSQGMLYPNDKEAKQIIKYLPEINL